MVSRKRVYSVNVPNPLGIQWTQSDAETFRTEAATQKLRCEMILEKVESITEHLRIFNLPQSEIMDIANSLQKIIDDFGE